MPRPGHPAPAGSPYPARAGQPATRLNPAVAARIRQLAAQAEHRHAVAEFHARHAADQQTRLNALLLEAIDARQPPLRTRSPSATALPDPACRLAGITPRTALWQSDRMTAQAALRAALRDIVGPQARAAGFKGSGSTWRSGNLQGDWAVVNVQSSSWNTAECVRCVINLAVAPAPWLDWLRESLGSLPKSVNESLGLYRDRLHPAGTPPGADGWWQISSDSDARAAAADMVVQLADHGWPTLTRLLNRQALLDSIRSGDLGHMKAEHHNVFFARAEALLIAGDGTSEQGVAGAWRTDQQHTFGNTGSHRDKTGWLLQKLHHLL